MRLIGLAVVLLTLHPCHATDAANWPQWLGGPERRNAATPADWRLGRTPAMKVLWQRPLGSGYASVAVHGPHLATQMTAGDDDFVVLLNARTGDERWRFRIGRKYAGHDGSIDGPLSTPALDADSVYALGPRGRLMCLRVADGTLRWEVNIKSKFQAKEPHYGFATSPLLEGDCVIVQTGGSGLIRGKCLVALDRRTGRVRWQTQKDLTVYSSPTAATLCGVRQIIVHSTKRVFAVAPADGTLLWSVNVPESSWTPLPLSGDRLFLATEDESRMLQIRRTGEEWELDTLWTSEHLAGLINAVTARDTALFGVSGRALRCVDATTGALLWESQRDMAPLLVGDVLLALEDRAGMLVALRAGRERYQELAEQQVYPVDGGTRVESPMAFSDGVLYIRTESLLVAVRVASGAH